MLHIDMEAEESIEDTHLALQESISNWGSLLIASGGCTETCQVLLSLDLL